MCMQKCGFLFSGLPLRSGCHAGEVGPARDWEVLANTTLPAVFKGAPADLLTEPRRGVAAMAGEKRQHAAQAVDSERYTQLILELCRWLESPDWRRDLDET